MSSYKQVKSWLALQLLRRAVQRRIKRQQEQIKKWQQEEDEIVAMLANGPRFPPWFRKQNKAGPRGG